MSRITINDLSEDQKIRKGDLKKIWGGSLEALIMSVESDQETIRNQRQMVSTTFENFDQKANQLYNMLSTVMKSMNEMRMGTIRNML